MHRFRRATAEQMCDITHPKTLPATVARLGSTANGTVSARSAQTLWFANAMLGECGIARIIAMRCARLTVTAVTTTRRLSQAPARTFTRRPAGDCYAGHGHTPGARAPVRTRRSTLDCSCPETLIRYAPSARRVDFCLMTRSAEVWSTDRLRPF